MGAACPLESGFLSSGAHDISAMPAGIAEFDRARGTKNRPAGCLGQCCSARSCDQGSGVGYCEKYRIRLFLGLFPIALRHRSGITGGAGDGDRQARCGAKRGRPGTLHRRRDAAVQRVRARCRCDRGLPEGQETSAHPVVPERPRAATARIAGVSNEKLAKSTTHGVAC
jgi:hypothetical protein